MRTLSRKVMLVIATSGLFQSSLFAAAAEAPASSVESPRLRAVERALDGGKAEVVTEFWREIERSQTPLIEDLRDHPENALYTFLWHSRPGQDTINVRLDGAFPMHSGKFNDTFRRLGETDIWFVSYTLPRDARLIYDIVAPTGLRASPERIGSYTMDGVEYEAFRDPLNQRVQPGQDAQFAMSSLSGPGATSNPYLNPRPNLPPRQLEALKVSSEILKSTREIRVYLPPSYGQIKGSLPLLLFFDGTQYARWMQVTTVLDNLIADRKIPPVMAAFLDSPDRNQELSPNEPFQQFLASELIPRLRAAYRVSPDPHQNIVIGSSLGGIAATYTAFTHPELFGNVISQSGSFWWWPERWSSPRGNPYTELTAESGWLLKKIAVEKKRPIRLYLEANLWEGDSMLLPNRMLSSILQGKGYSFTYREHPGAHAAVYWMQTLPEAMVQMLGKGTSR